MIDQALRWFRTVRDIPPSQLGARLYHEVERRVVTRLPEIWRKRLLLGTTIALPAPRTSYLATLRIDPGEDVFSSSGTRPSYSFRFLNKTRVLDGAIVWNHPSYERLWQFHLHYFDWLRERLNASYLDPAEAAEVASSSRHLIADWIAGNAFFSFDGWHPYPTSLRIVNWVYAIRAFPALATDELLSSLWQQLLYLNTHTETFAGGNHLLENLRALIIGGLLFDSPHGETIVQRALAALEQQLAVQVLADGGHYEFSPSYHLAMTNALAETVACLRSAAWQVPEPLTETLARMIRFARAIRLSSGRYPLWNDSAYNAAPPLDEVVSWGSCLLGLPVPDGVSETIDPLHQRLLQAAGRANTLATTRVAPEKLVSLPSSGYYLLRDRGGFRSRLRLRPTLPQGAAGARPRRLPEHRYPMGGEARRGRHRDQRLRGGAGEIIRTEYPGP